MSAVLFDTHEFVKSLHAAGMPVAQAEVISSALRNAQAMPPDAATKADLRAVSADTESKFAQLQKDIVRLDAKVDILEAKVDALVGKFDLLKWLTGAVLVAVLAPLIKSLF